ncbi:hypothetical protein [Lutibacter sp.]|uniref:hypothetical protein n=1 Tax=Lutibacter sp. TaxID=1925666 RepID=UPI0025C15FCD|nr:hypothetical protein [Lutibacter sp.]MCF6182766.1 hypothetical protein [Lutibacter sp.]
MNNIKTVEDVEKANNYNELKFNAEYHIDECITLRERLIGEKNLLILARVNGVEIGLCDNEKFIELLNNEIKQAKLCLESKPNKFAKFLFCM